MRFGLDRYHGHVYRYLLVAVQSRHGSQFHIAGGRCGRESVFRGRASEHDLVVVTGIRADWRRYHDEPNLDFLLDRRQARL